MLFAGRLHPDKGVHEFLEAARALRDTESIRLAVVGERDPPSLYPGTRSAVLEAHRDGIVEWRGYRDDVAGLMVAADILVVPTYYSEGVPQVMLEGAAMGLALILTDNVGCREYLAQLERPRPIPVRDARALAERMVALAADPSGRGEMGAEARSIAINNYSQGRHVSQILDQLCHLPDNASLVER